MVEWWYVFNMDLCFVITGRYSKNIHFISRRKSGTKRSMIVVDGKGVPPGITVDAANRHDMKMTKTTLQSMDSSS